MRVAPAPSKPALRVEAGSAAGDWPRRLSLGIEAALETLGQAFLDHPANAALRTALLDRVLSAERYHIELLGLVYRCMFLFSAEARGALHPAGSAPEARLRYAHRYGMQRLRRGKLQEQADWSVLQALFRALARGEPRLALAALGGIFAESRCPWLDAAQLDHRALASAVCALGWRPVEQGAQELRWGEVTPEMFGSAYESLLALRPALCTSGGQLRWQVRDERLAGMRRSTGSYYTPDHLVQAVLDAALEPIVRDTLAAHPEQPARALLKLAIVDPACGSGYFLLAAARRLAGHVARHSAQSDSTRGYRAALRRVLASCLFGVDLNPMAVELCRLSLWLEAADGGLALGAFDAQIRQGNSLLGATPELMQHGVPDGAWSALPGDDKRVARSLKLRNRQARALAAPPGEAGPTTASSQQRERQLKHQQGLADAWCAAFAWPKLSSSLADVAPTNELWRPAQQGLAELPAATRERVAELAGQYHFFHWHLAFPAVFSRGGFDLALGNPPWIAHAGRASQTLPAAVKRFFECNYESFADYPTTHGMFVYVAARSLREGGYLGLVIPSSLSELGGYAPTRVAHDRLCDFPAELVDFGEGQFAGVTQPCMALVSRRAAAGRRDAALGHPWPMQRQDLDATARTLIARLASLPTLPAELFAERGVQSDRALLQHFVAAKQPTGRFDAPIREGTDVREFELRAPRWHVDRTALGARMRTAEEFRRVSVLVRQTARYPIAALSDGLAFRNSLLAVFETPAWPAPALVALLNSALIRWLHYVRFRDARQPILPQLKIAHLRSIPAPRSSASALCLQRLGQRGCGEPAHRASVREGLDELVFRLYELDQPERELVSRWHAELAPRPPRGAAEPRLAP